MEYAIQMGSVAMIQIRSFIKIGSDIQNSQVGFRDRQHGDPISLLLSSKNKERGLKMVIGEVGWGGMD
jgi:hypothetical protein